MSSKTIFLTMAIWDKIRGRFAADEKKVINAARVGERLCPRGSYLDRDVLGSVLTAKLEDAIWAQRSVK